VEERLRIVKRWRLLVFLLLLVASATAGTSGALYTLKRAPGVDPDHPAAPIEPIEPSKVSSEPLADWCAPGYEPIGGGCLALPSGTEAAQPLIVYLHGRYARDAAAEEVDRQRRLAAAATGRGFAVLAFRGRLGECTATELASWFCWPSNEHNEDDADAVVDGWNDALTDAHRRAGSDVELVLGFSNGAYFAGLIAARGLLPAEAFVIAHGGPVEPVEAPPTMPPLLLLSADDDVAQDEMIRLDGDVTREGWPHDSYARGGVHGLTDGDIDAALTFFTRAHEPMPLDPPLPLHRPAYHPHAPPAAEPSGASPDDDAGP
jgi:predicted esterase